MDDAAVRTEDAPLKIDDLPGLFGFRPDPVLFRPYVAAGVLLLILWLLSRMALLSWADLSYVLPVTSVGYILVALVGRVMLHEQITPLRWAGIVLIMSGVALVSGGAPRTHAPKAETGVAAGGAR
jgi:drug/metabolite transporter (DMT)-like permease